MTREIVDHLHVVAAIGFNLKFSAGSYEESIDSITSMCMACTLIHVKMIAQCLLFARPPRVLLEVTDNGPNTSNPTKVNGGSILKRSEGRPSSALPVCRATNDMSHNGRSNC